MSVDWADTGADLSDADMTGTEVYAANVNKKTKLFGARIDPDSELAEMSQAITTARLRRSGEGQSLDNLSIPSDLIALVTDIEATARRLSGNGQTLWLNLLLG
ncbi:MAG TPA: hypothetical protein VMR90_07600 [Candidatus Cybelea sp.]|nr:hypothetical protein [Candidatus Cybelea sp.]